MNSALLMQRVAAEDDANTGPAGPAGAAGAAGPGLDTACTFTGGAGEYIHPPAGGSGYAAINTAGGSGTWYLDPPTKDGQAIWLFNSGQYGQPGNVRVNTQNTDPHGFWDCSGSTVITLGSLHAACLVVSRRKENDNLGAGYLWRFLGGPGATLSAP